MEEFYKLIKKERSRVNRPEVQPFFSILEELAKYTEEIEDKVLQINKKKDLGINIKYKLFEKGNILNGYFPVDSNFTTNLEFSKSKFLGLFYVNSTYNEYLKLIKKENINVEFIDKEGIKHLKNVKIKSSSKLIEKESLIGKFSDFHRLFSIPIYNPYARRIVELFLSEETKVELSEFEIIDIDLLEYSSIISKTLIPAWNIKISSDKIDYVSKVPHLSRTLFKVELPSRQEDMVYVYNEDLTFVERHINNPSIITVEGQKFNEDFEILQVFIPKSTNANEDVFGKDLWAKREEVLGYLPKTKYQIEYILKNVLNIEFYEAMTPGENIEFSYPKHLKYYQSEAIDDIIFFKKNVIYLKFRRIDDIFYFDKIEFVIAFMTSLYPDIEWQGVL